MSDELKERLENNFIDYVFKVNVPAKSYKEFYAKVDTFCKDNYGDVRWMMFSDLIDKALVDWKYAVLYDELLMLKAQVADLKESKGVNVNQSPRVKTFGKSLSKREVEEIGDRYE